MALKYKIAASDFDGTLLKNDDTISPDTAKTIRQYIKDGGLFLIATGRMHRAIINRLIDVGLDNLDIPLISYQGALVKNAKTDEILQNYPLKKETALKIVKEANRQGIYVHTYIDDQLYVSKEESWTRTYADYLRISFTEVGDLYNFMEKTLKDKGGPSCHKVLMIMEHELLDAKLDEFLLKYGDEATFNTSSEHLLECVSKDAGKDKAIERIAIKMGLSLDDVIAFGDSLNDYTMIKNAGLGIAVENAVERLKKIAKKITKTNDQDGVAYGIKKWAY